MSSTLVKFVEPALVHLAYPVNEFLARGIAPGYELHFSAVGRLDYQQCPGRESLLVHDAQAVVE
jgi:hypothetical protein